MYWDKFDIVEAYYCFACSYLVGNVSLIKAFRGKPEYKACQLVQFCRKIDRQLFKLGFEPRLSLQNPEPRYLSENGKLIYMQLVRKYFSC